MKILIIDDERAIRGALKEILTDEGYEVEVAEDGAGGCAAALKERFDAIFCDIKMPGMEGTEVLSKLVAEGVESPIIMISGHADIETAVRCIKDGAFDFIQKPLDLNRILITIKNIKCILLRRNSDATVVAYLCTSAYTSFLCGDNDDTVRTAATVDSCGRSVLQHRKALDIIRIDHRKRVGKTFHTLVVHCKSINNDKRVVRCVQRRSSTNTD